MNAWTMNYEPVTMNHEPVTKNLLCAKLQKKRHFLSNVILRRPHLMQRRLRHPLYRLRRHLWRSSWPCLCS
jgi:hypothetical protein